MANTNISLMDLFQRIKWASSGTIYDMSKTNYNWGWGFLGDDTPTVQDFNFVQQCNDEKDQWLFNQINEVLKEQGIQATEQEITSLRDAIKKMIKSFEDGLKSPNGFKFIGKCESIEQLRTIEPTEDNQRILVKGYYAGSNVGGGEFYADLSDKATADNGGTVIVTNEGLRWKRIYTEITPFDFGANGDIYVNNDESFARLEQAIENTPVNMCGAYFLVTAPFVRNIYYNGKFKTSVIGSYSRERMHSGGSLYIRHIGTSAGFLDLKPCLEDGLTEYFQGLYQDPKDGYIWSLQGDAGKPAVDHKCSFVKYAPAYGGVAEPLFHSTPSNAIGHQCFGIQYDEFVRYFWSPAGSALTTERGKYIARHVVDEKTGAVTSNTYLISDTAKGDASNCLCITPNGEFLLATCGVWIGDKQDTYDWRLKVFRISDITATDGTTVPPAVFEFPLYRINSYAVQSIACDGDFVYVQYGDNALSRNALAVYTIDGAHVLTDLQNFIGINDAKAIVDSGGKQYFEPEALAIFQNGQEPILVHGYILGEAKNSEDKQFRLYTTSVSKPVFNKSFSNFPQQIFESGKNIGIPSGKWLTFGEFDNIGGWTEILAAKKGQVNLSSSGSVQLQYKVANALKSGMLQVSNNGNFGLYDNTSGNWLIGTDTNGNAFVQKDFVSTIKIKYSDTSQPQFVAENSLRSGMLQVSSGGNFGLYDLTNKKWLVYSGVDGVPMIAKSPDLSANGDQIPTTYWVNKVIKNAFTQSLTTNGWQKLPNGLIMQWGRYDASNGTRTFNFPIAFTEACYICQPSDWNNSGSGTHPVTSRDVTTTGFTIEANDNLGGFMMFAIGV
ncbi:Uncharacterised protein [Actinobacillus lignieresii]|uniref:gp53-like domain-containing protein n=1 Tax=Actinobacillus lignieresii TaxID=720 RepID=UPI000F71EFE8|nr:hypothetical protein [Actinobacillus lignieresii]VEB26143.1 Uncharacterised protein [Actinobacillus lignieresii]